MTTFSFTLTPELRSSLIALDAVRVKLLTIPLSPKAELKYRWEAITDRLYYSLLLSGINVNKNEVISTLSTSSYLRKPKKLSSNQKLIIKYKKGLDIISHNWIMNDRPLTTRTVIALHEVAATGTLKAKESELRQILDYLQTGADHPVVQAAIVYAAIEELHPFTDGNGRISRLLTLLFLYKSGFDVRGMLSIEKNWYQNKEEFIQTLDQGIHNAHMTRWIEYFAKTLLTQLLHTIQEISDDTKTNDNDKNLFSLNERQKEILSLLDDPNSNITNRQIQKYFNISQITSSRDLSHLSTLGLLIPRGKGRSVYYTKV